ncbi:unnamed protein product [Ascophyllum nodosum]
MEALVHIAYDRISEDIILLYDAMCAYKEMPVPRPNTSCVIHAITCSLTRDSEKAMRHAWSTNGTGSRGFREKGQVGQVNSEGEEEADKAMPLVKDSQMLEFVRDLMTSVVSDFAVMPFWAVKISAVAQRGRLPQLWPFAGFIKAFSSILEKEGVAGLFKGWVPICAAGLLRYFRRGKLLYTDYYWKTTRRVTTRFIMSSGCSRNMNDREVRAQTHEGVVAKMLWACILHPFDLIATRMVTESSPQYATTTSSVSHVLGQRGVTGLFLGVRSSIFNVLLPFGKWYMVGVPFLIKTRRMLDGMDTVFRTGMGGSLDMVRAILKEEGVAGLFAGYRATLWGTGPAFLSLCGARLLVYAVMGSSRRTAAHRRKRNAHLRHLMESSQKDGRQRKGRQVDCGDKTNMTKDKSGDKTGRVNGGGGKSSGANGARFASKGNDWRPYPFDARFGHSFV